MYTKDIKRIVIQLYEKFKDQLSTDFETNKKFVDKYIDIQSKKVRNRIAGYLTRYVKMQKSLAKKETKEEYVEEENE